MTETKEPPVIDAATWTNYADHRPEKGLCEWRIPSLSLSGEYVIVAAMMRVRGAGYGDPVLSPAFDRWDGYRVHVPSGLQWRPASDPDRKVIHAELICVEGLEHADCIYCGERPKLNGCQRSGDGRGVIVNGDPWRFNSWWLSCCRWGGTPHLDDPREIERIRREAIERASLAPSAPQQAATAQLPSSLTVREKLTSHDPVGWYECHNEEDESNDLRCYWWDGRELRWGPLDQLVLGAACLTNFRGLVPAADLEQLLSQQGGQPKRIVGDGKTQLPRHHVMAEDVADNVGYPTYTPFSTFVSLGELTIKGRIYLDYGVPEFAIPSPPQEPGQ